MEKTKCITFDKAAQDALPEHIKAKMIADRNAQREKESSLQHIIRSGERTYFVKFYDIEAKLLVHANSFVKAGILAMAYRILSEGSGFGIEYVEDMKGTKVPVDIKD